MASKKNKESKIFPISVIVFAFIASGCIGYLLWDVSRAHNMICSVTALDQITGLVKLECVR